MAKCFKVSFRLITEDRDYTAKDIEARLDEIQFTDPIEIDNIKIKKSIIAQHP